MFTSGSNGLVIWLRETEGFEPWWVYRYVDVGYPVGCLRTVYGIEESLPLNWWLVW